MLNKEIENENLSFLSSIIYGFMNFFLNYSWSLVDDIGILEEESEDDRKWRQGLRKRFHHLWTQCLEVIITWIFILESHAFILFLSSYFSRIVHLFLNFIQRFLISYGLFFILLFINPLPLTYNFEMKEVDEK